jgi:LmbE family N-acetylglucosaminyl deacetylase
MVIVLSPHLDDAVFSAWHVLISADQVEVINIFAGVPECGFVTPLDRAHGAEESAAWVERRRAEDRAVLASIGRSVRNLDLLDVAYRAEAMGLTAKGGEPAVDDFVATVAAQPALAVAPEELRSTIVAALPAGSTIYAPVGIGGHPDHVAVRKVAVLLAGEGWTVRLYADSPYFARWGLPSWLGSKHNPDADAYIDRVLHSAAPRPLELHRNDVELSDSEVDHKIEATRRYVTEFAFIDADFAGKSSDAEIMRHEVWWDVRRTDS